MWCACSSLWVCSCPLYTRQCPARTSPMLPLTQPNWLPEINQVFLQVRRTKKGKSGQIRGLLWKRLVAGRRKARYKFAHKPPAPDLPSGSEKTKQKKNPSSSDCNLYLGRGTVEEEEEGRTRAESPRLDKKEKHLPLLVQALPRLRLSCFIFVLIFQVLKPDVDLDVLILQVLFTLENCCCLVMGPSVTSLLHHCILKAERCAKKVLQTSPLWDHSHPGVCACWDPWEPLLWPPSSSCATVSMFRRCNKGLFFSGMLFSGYLGYFMHNLTVRGCSCEESWVKSKQLEIGFFL